jgi:hypothetical protein
MNGDCLQRFAKQTAPALNIDKTSPLHAIPGFLQSKETPKLWLPANGRKVSRASWIGRSSTAVSRFSSPVDVDRISQHPQLSAGSNDVSAKPVALAIAAPREMNSLIHA